MKKSWFSIENKGKNETTISIYDEIGMWGISAREFIKELSAIKVSTITVNISCPGGSVFDGTAIFNALKEHSAKIITNIQSIALSMGSIVALAGEVVNMAENGFFMIHNPTGGVLGGSEEMRKQADLLDKVKLQLAGVYMKKTGKSEAQINELMDAETWFTAKEAKADGFIDHITGEVEVTAHYDLSIFKNVPKDANNIFSAKVPSKRDIENKLREVAHLSNSDAKMLLSKGYDSIVQREVEQSQQRDVVDKTKTLTKSEDNKMTLAEFQAKYPDLAKSIVDNATVEAMKIGMIEGAEAELKRIKAVEDQLILGHEKLINELKFDGKTTGPEAAVKILAQEKVIRKTTLDNIKDDAPDPIDQIEDIESTKINANLPVEERTKQAWDSKPEIRSDYGTYDRYLAFIKADEAGQSKVLVSSTK